MVWELELGETTKSQLLFHELHPPAEVKRWRASFFFRAATCIESVDPDNEPQAEVGLKRKGNVIVSHLLRSRVAKLG